MRRVRNLVPISEFHRRLLLLVQEMEIFDHYLVFMVDDGACYLRICREEAGAVEILKRHFPEAKGSGAAGDGTEVYELPSFDGSLPDGYAGQALIDEAHHFRFLDRAQWVRITKQRIYVWRGGDRLDSYALNGLGRTTLPLGEETTLDAVRRLTDDLSLRE